jgi:predicted  nucleic acid-binding Zn-ribbon protein
MNIRLRQLLVTTRRTVERIDFSESVTFLYGPISTGKSTVARLIDYCFGGELERTPAIQQEFVSVQLFVDLGVHSCKLERASVDLQGVRATWSSSTSTPESIIAPIDPGEVPIVGESVFNLSDLIFYLCGVEPIKVRKRARDPDSPMIRLSFRDVWHFCYLDQAHLDSSFFRFEDPFRGRKSQDALRFFTGLHSERLSQLETELYRTVDEQQGKREAVRQIRQFMARFQLGSEIDVEAQIGQARTELADAEARRAQLEAAREVKVHPTDPMREQLRKLGAEIDDLLTAIRATEDAVSEQRALRAELITTKIKADRAEQAGRLLEGVGYARCPQCGTDVTRRTVPAGSCTLCCSTLAASSPLTSLELEAVRRELNDRIDQIADSIGRRERGLLQSKRRLEQLRDEKNKLDQTLQRELARYDSAFVDTVRALDREIATLAERMRSLAKLQEMPRAINDLEEQAGALQGKIDRIRTDLEEERGRLRQADQNLAAIARHFKAIMIAVGFPGVVESDEVVIDPRDWRPRILHDSQVWTFWDAGSGGKKTLFNVCFALAIQQAARGIGLPVPNVLVIDSPTKNISDDENPELVQSLYREIYRLAAVPGGKSTQFLLIDSDLVEPVVELASFKERHLAGTESDPSLIPYYSGP